MKSLKLILLVLIVMCILIACGNDKSQQVQSKQPPLQEEPVIQEETTEVVSENVDGGLTDSSFPVPIIFENKKVKLEDLPEATQIAIQWTYDYFSTEGIQTEDEFYEMMKAKYYPNVEVPSEEEMDSTKESFLMAGYGSERLPAFTPGQAVERIEVWREVPIGLTIKVPLYVKLKGKENMHAMAISYAPDLEQVLGVDKDFPMPLD